MKDEIILLDNGCQQIDPKDVDNFHLVFDNYQYFFENNNIIIQLFFFFISHQGHTDALPLPFFHNTKLEILKLKFNSYG